MEDVENAIRQHIVHKIMLKKDESILKNDDSLLETGIIDSLGIQMLVSFLEKEYHVTVPEEDLNPENFETVKTVASLVGKLKKTS